GEGAYDETERAIQELLGIDEPLLDPIRPEDAPGALLEPQSEDVEGPYSGPYRAGGVWAVLEGSGSVTVNGRRLDVSGPGCYELISHPVSTAGELELEPGPGVRCHAVCFTPGLAGDAPSSDAV
ncbi:MAG TPA: DipZ protein, partial [Solirubrobacteraceae bacterium]|nr:DipZ protein [Solirubrobacteraceae bacterium]